MGCLSLFSSLSLCLIFSFLILSYLILSLSLLLSPFPLLSLSHTHSLTFYFYFSQIFTPPSTVSFLPFPHLPVKRARRDVAWLLVVVVAFDTWREGKVEGEGEARGGRGRGRVKEGIRRDAFPSLPPLLSTPFSYPLLHPLLPSPSLSIPQ